MTHRTDVARGRDIIARWCRLAEQRLEHLTELFETGRWRRYHSEAAFLENIKEAKSAVETWRDLSLREASLDHAGGDVSWLGQARATLPRGEARRDPAPRFSSQPLWFAVEPLPALPIAAQVLPASPVETAAIPAIVASAIDAAAISLPSFGPDLRPSLARGEFELNDILPSVPEAAASAAMPAMTDQRGIDRAGSTDAVPDHSASARLLGPASDYLPEPTLDLAMMQLRYPLLRNAL